MPEVRNKLDGIASVRFQTKSNPVTIKLLSFLLCQNQLDSFYVFPRKSFEHFARSGYGSETNVSNDFSFIGCITKMRTLW